MADDFFLGFDFGYKRIGVAVGQRLTLSANPLSTIKAKQGIPDWNEISSLIRTWNPQGLVVGIPTKTDDTELYTTSAARRFARQLRKHSQLEVHLVDERFSTVEARQELFEEGGYRKLKQSEVDSIAACLILEQWLRYPE